MPCWTTQRFKARERDGDRCRLCCDTPDSPYCRLQVHHIHLVICEPGEGNDFYVRNIGNNTALNVKVRTVVLSPPVYANHSAMAAFPWSVPFLCAGESQPLRVRTATVGGEAAGEDFLFEILRPVSEVAKLEADPFPLSQTACCTLSGIEGIAFVGLT